MKERYLAASIDESEVTIFLAVSPRMQDEDDLPNESDVGQSFATKVSLALD
jgi:hypothetical protein